MKKTVFILMLGIIFAFASVSTVLASTVNIIVNGDLAQFPDAQPYINQDNRTMVPVRFVSQQLGADVS